MIDLTRRTGVSLLLAVVGHAVLLAVQADATLFQRVTFAVFSEAQRAVNGAVGAAGELRDTWAGWRAVRAENEELRRQLDATMLQWQADRRAARRVPYLEALLDLRGNAGLSTVGARIIAGDATTFFRTVTIDRGWRDGVRRDAAVLSPAGVVGRVVGEPGARASRVQLLIDRSAAAAALTERTRAVGLVMGGGDDRRFDMAYVSNIEDVEVGDIVVTSGRDGVYPSGFVIGDVTAVRRGSGPYRTVRVRPRVRFDDLREVLVEVPGSPPPASPAAGGGE